MIEIEVSGKPPIIIGDKRVTRIEVHPMKFVTFVKMAEDVAAATNGDKKKFALLNRRARFKRQAIPYAGDKRLEFGDTDIAQLPIEYGVKINTALENSDPEPGELVRQGDSITSSTIFRLGTPIGFQQNNESGSFQEIEFVAKTFGDIEEILAESSEPQQMLAALRTIGKPLGASDTLLSLPSWAIDQISVADGFAMVDKVLPRFLG